MKKRQISKVLLLILFISKTVMAQEYTSTSQIQKTASVLKKLQTVPMVVSEAYPNDVERSQKIVRGVPALVEFQAAGSRVFRHYTSKSNAELIKNSSALRAGNLPYIQVGGGGMRTIYQDLTGVFLTTPNYSASAVGVDRLESTVAIDFQLNAETPILKIEAGIYLVPGAPQYPEWIIEKYQQFLSNKNMKATKDELALFERITTTGLKPLLLPIH